MANQLYGLARQAFLSQSPALDWDTDNIKVILAKTSAGYTVSIDVDQFVGNGTTPIATANIIARSPNLASKTVTLGVADAAGTTFTAVSGAVSGALVIYKDTGADSSSPLIAYIDTATGLPVTPNGGDINVAWNTGANKIFKL
jgi:hypothetical protein